jgi:CRP/FNR family transcriptional regulator, anaerobic regulatory protein
MILTLNLQDNPQVQWKKIMVDEDSIMGHFGDDFNSLIAVKTGSFKSFVNTEDRREQIINFYFPEDLIALESIASGYLNSTVKALKNSMICYISYLDALKVILSHPIDHNPLVALLSATLDQGIRFFPVLQLLRSK